MELNIRALGLPDVQASLEKILITARRLGAI